MDYEIPPYIVNIELIKKTNAAWLSSVIVNVIALNVLSDSD